MEKIAHGSTQKFKVKKSSFGKLSTFETPGAANPDHLVGLDFVPTTH